VLALALALVTAPHLHVLMPLPPAPASRAQITQLYILFIGITQLVTRHLSQLPVNGAPGQRQGEDNGKET